MAYNSWNNHGKKWYSGNLAITLATTITLTIAELFEFALNKKNKLNVLNLHNSGQTKFDEFRVLAAYIRAGGVGSVAARLIGYTESIERTASSGLMQRLLGMNIHTIRLIHEKMKKDGLVAPMKPFSINKGGQVPIFYTFERLLELYYEDKGGYDAIVPPKLKNWKPKKTSQYYRWFK